MTVPDDRPVRRIVFPASDAPASPATDPDIWLAAFARAMAQVTRAPVTIDATTDAPPPPTMAFARGDGLRLALALPATLAAAIVGARCGGAFDADGIDLAAPSVARIVAELAATACDAADTIWPGTGDWSRARPAPGPAALAATLRTRDHRFELGVTIILPPAQPAGLSTDARARHGAAVRAALDMVPLDLRVVLHDAVLPLGRACALRAGDVVPIDTARDFQLRIGDVALARGTIAPDGHGGHRITIAAAARGIRPISEDPR